jgi:hypothetical protein
MRVRVSPDPPNTRLSTALNYTDNVNHVQSDQYKAGYSNHKIQTANLKIKPSLKGNYENNNIKAKT